MDYKMGLAGLAALCAMGLSPSAGSKDVNEVRKSAPDIFVSKSASHVCVEAYTPSSYTIWCKVANDERIERISMTQNHKRIFMRDEQGDGSVDYLAFSQTYSGSKLFTYERRAEKEMSASEIAVFKRTDEIFKDTKKKLGRYVNLEKIYQEWLKNKPSGKEQDYALEFLEEF